MSSSTEICNLAISHLNISAEIGNLETERSAEAAACRRFYEICRDEVLADFPWPFATKQVTLALVEEFTESTAEWRYSYAVPTDCASFIRILSGSRNDTRQSRVPYKFYDGASGPLIYTDWPDAIGEYTKKETDPSRYAPGFVIALSYLIAHRTAPRLTGGDPFKLGERARQLYVQALSKAQANAVNEDQPEEDPPSEFIRARA